MLILHNISQSVCASINVKYGFNKTCNLFLYQVDLGILHRVSAVATVGCTPILHLTTDFLLEYAAMDKKWILLPSQDPSVNMVS